jgi:hypothetical protein
VLLVLLLGASGYFVLGGTPAPEVELGTVELDLGPRSPAPGTPPAAESTARSTELVSLPVNTREGAGGEPSTVLWPLEVRLELKAPSDAPTRDGLSGIAMPGAGATARLVGRIGARTSGGAQAEIRFIAGPNTGRVLHTDSEGRFGATNLYPGLSIVDVSGPGLVGAQRELRLRQRREAMLNLGFGRLGAVQGQVLGRPKEPVEGALVRIDGHETQTDADGFFYLGSLASGQAFIEIEKPGFSAHREMVNITANATVPAGRLKYLLEVGSTLILTIDGNVGGPGPVEVWITSGNPKRLSGFPFWRINPIRMQPGELREIPDLPKELVRVQAWRTGAACNPESRNVNLRASGRMPLKIELRSAEKIVGRVLSEGKPAQGARVVLEAPDRVQAALRHYRQPTTFLESGFMPLGPSALQETETDGLGRFILTAWSDGSPARYISAESKDGKRFVSRLIDTSDRDISLDLVPREAGRGLLALDLSDRYQGLPITWTLNGEPGADILLEPGDPLEFAGLREGTWSVEVKWNTETLLAEPNVEVTAAETRLGLTLPEGAITGQDREAWLRAGRDYPY